MKNNNSKLKNNNSKKYLSTKQVLRKRRRNRVIIIATVLSVTVYLLWPASETYVKNDSLNTLRSTWPGNRLVGETYTNMPEVFGYTGKAWTWCDELILNIRQNMQKNIKDQDDYRLTATPIQNLWQSTDNTVVWLGHASFFIRLDGVSFLTDPSYAQNAGNHPRLVPQPALEQLRGLDYILLSSNQPYHADKSTLEQIRTHNPTSMILAPMGLPQWLNDPVNLIQEAGWFQEYETYGKIRIYLLPARSWSGETLFDRDKTLWGSFIIQTPAHTLYFAGSSGWGDHYAQIAQIFPTIDYAFIPIGAYQPEPIMNKSHLTPDDVARLSQVLKPKHIIPMSYGTYDLSLEPLGEPLERFQGLIEEGRLTGEAHILEVGQFFALP